MKTYVGRTGVEVEVIRLRVEPLVRGGVLEE